MVGNEKTSEWDETEQWMVITMEDEPSDRWHDWYETKDDAIKAAKKEAEDRGVQVYVMKEVGWVLPPRGEPTWVDGE